MANVSRAILLRKAKNQSFWLNDFVKLAIFHVISTKVGAIFNPPLASRPSINFTKCNRAVVGCKPRPDVVRRPSVTTGLQMLEGKHLIRSTRRAIAVLDR